MLSGGRDSVCLLDLAVRAAGRRRGQRAARQLRAARRLGRGRGHCAELCERLGVELDGRATAAPRGRPATCRPGRATRATRPRRALARRGRRDDRHRPHRRRPGRDDPLPARLLAEPAGAARDAAPRRHAWCGRCSASPAQQTTAYCEERGWPGATTPATTRPTFARNRVRHGLMPALAEIHPAAAAERAAHGGAAARRGRGARRAGRRRARRPTAAARGTIALRAPRRAAAGAAPPGRPAARRPRRRPPGARRRPLTPTQVAGLRRTGIAMLDLGGGVRAVARSAASSAPSATLVASISRLRRVSRTPRSARPSSPARTCSGASPSSGRRSAATTRAATWSWSACSRARCSSSPT